MHGARAPLRNLLFGVLCWALCAPLVAQQLVPDAPEPPPAPGLPVQVFKGPRAQHIAPAGYPPFEVRTGGEGWVLLSIMVDTQGKPFEVAVMRSTGNKAFEDRAVQAMQRSTFVPASLDGRPVESAAVIKYVFINSRAKAGISDQEFVGASRALEKALHTSDRPAADAALERLRQTIKTLKDDVYYGLALYEYASRWGTVDEQLAGLRRAFAGEHRRQRYLTEVQWRDLLLDTLKVDIEVHDYADALSMWDLLTGAGLDRDTAARIQPIIDRIKRLRTDDEAYTVSGTILGLDWMFHLYKPHFRASIEEGSLAQVQLACERGFVYFRFDPKLAYTVQPKYGSCVIRLAGTPGTRFKLIQF